MALSLINTAAVALVALLAFIAVPSDAQLAYQADVYFYYAPAASYCYINTGASNGPITCVSQPNLSGGTAFALTGENAIIGSGAYVTSPTIPAILDGGSLSKWCFPRNYTGNANNSIYCSGAPITGWFQLIKVGGLGSDYIYNGDSVVFFSTLSNDNCSISSNVVYCDPSITSPAVFTVII